jgi:hypothetical protein
MTRGKKLLASLPSTVAGVAALGAMTLVKREWAAQVGLLVYFPVLVLMTDGFTGLLASFSRSRPD